VLVAGSLRQRGRSSWELRVHAGRDELTGKKLYVTRTVRSGRRDAERELARLVASVEEAAKVVKAGTVGELCEKWSEITGPELSPAVSGLFDQPTLIYSSAVAPPALVAPSAPPQRHRHWTGGRHILPETHQEPDRAVRARTALT
jgi:hypothetical protein